MPVVSATVICAARTTSSKLVRTAASIAGSEAGSPVSGVRRRALARQPLFGDVEVDGSLRLQHPHELLEIEAERVGEPGPEGNVAHCVILRGQA